MSDEQIIDKAVRSAKTPRPLILLSEGGTRYIFDAERVTIGRADDCDIVLSYNKSASPTHIVFSRGEKGWTIMDAGTVNGTWLNNQKLESCIPHRLHNTDVIIIPEEDGESVIIYDDESYEPEPVKKAPDDTVILDEPSMLWSDKFVILTSLPEKKQKKTRRSFLKYDQDGNLYSGIPSPEYMCEHNFKQCKHCGAFAEKKKKICPSCRHILPFKSLGYTDPVVFTDDYKDAVAEINSITDRMFPNPAGMGWCFRIWGMKQAILRERYHIIWRTPSEMNPHIIFD